METSELLIRFSDQSPSYTYGFEAGIIWQMMETGIKDFNRTIRVENIEVVKDMCLKMDYVFDLKKYGQDEFEGWADIFAIKKTSTDN